MGNSDKNFSQLKILQEIPLPAEVATIYEAVDHLEKQYGRKFTPDGHLVGSIGEVIAKVFFELELYPHSHEAHDAIDKNGREVQIKLTGGTSIEMSGSCDRLIVMRILNPEKAGLIYDGDGDIAWNNCGKLQKNGQRNISLKKLQELRKSKS
ncbi:MAG: hypothetical protein WC521_03380 [Bdellovibrionales bacterium]|jgi:hypothetical protein